METTKLTKLASCSGCGAKAGAGTLCKILKGLPTHFDENLIVGYDTSDDCCVYKVDDNQCVLQSIDFFPPIVDDPYTYGKIAATNALSDIFAMGANPKLAMNVFCITDKMTDKDISEILRGGYDACYKAGAIIAGGHTIRGSEPLYGLSVTGFSHPSKVLRNSKANVGDVLFLTKPIGIGIATTAHKGGIAKKELYQKAIKQMCTLNKVARDIMVKYDVHGCTDITGFGLMGHCLELAEGADVSIKLEYDKIPKLDGILELAEIGMLPEGMYRNRKFAEKSVKFDDKINLAQQDILFDPQTSGGLLIAVDEKDAANLEKELKEEIPYSRRIGYISKKGEYRIYVQK